MNPSKRDQRKADAFNQKRREEAPLFAHMGLVEQVTAEQVAERREEQKASAAAHIGQIEASTQAAILESEAIIVRIYGQDALDRAYALFGGWIDMPSTRWMLTMTWRRRAERGEPIVQPWQPGDDKARRAVEDETILQALGKGAVPSISDLCDRIGCWATVLDVTAAVSRLRAQGRVLHDTGKTFGFRRA